MSKKFYKFFPAPISRMQAYKKRLEAEGYEVMIFETSFYYELYW